VRTGQRGHLLCVGETGPWTVTPQCPYEPTNAHVVRAFQPVEREVLACHPPANQYGRMRVRMHLHGTGTPEQVYFTDVVPDEAQALCLGRVLCALRLPTFRAVTATVEYEYLVYLTSPDRQPE
jgi:hypothetical protein